MERTRAPGHPAMVKITTSHMVSSSVFGSSSARPPVFISSILGRKTLNIVYANREQFHEQISE